MKVILQQAVPKLGKQGQVVNVKPGYARNFLFPQGMALLADKKQLEVLERRNAKVAAQLADTKANAEALKEKLNGKDISIETKSGGDGRLFGAVTSQDICDAIKAQLGSDIDKKAVLLLRPIKRLGHYDIELDIHRDVTIELSLHVFDPEHMEVEKKAEPEAPVAVVEEAEEEADEE